MRLLVLALLAVATVAPAQVRLDVFQNGKKIGVATYAASLTPQGGKQSRLVLTATIGKVEAENVDEVVTDARGQTLLRRTSTRLTRPTAREVESVTVRFASDGTATVTAKAGGREETKTFPRPKGSRRDQSEFWFLKQAPSRGTWVQFENFALDSRTWESCRTTFTGVRKVTAGGREVRANLLTQVRPSRTDLIYLDDHGMPVYISAGKARLERRW